MCKKYEEERVYQILERKLWDDPTRVGLYHCHTHKSYHKASTQFGIYSRTVYQILERKLWDDPTRVGLYHCHTQSYHKPAS